MERLNNLGLGIKLNLLLLAVLMILLLATIALLTYNTGQLTQEIGSERVAEEVSIMQKRLLEVEKELTIDVNFTASSLPFVQAVGRRSSEAVTDLINTASSVLVIHGIDVVDGDGQPLASLRPEGEVVVPDFVLLSQALGGTTTHGLLVENQSGDPHVTINVAAPVNSPRQGTVLGAVQMSQDLNDEFLKTLTFGRSRVSVALVYEGRIYARTQQDATSTDSVLYEEIAFDPVLAGRAAQGETILADELISSRNIPYAVAYLPLLTVESNLPVSLMVVVKLDEIFTFQNRTLVNTILVFAVLASITVVIIFLALQRIIVLPLKFLKTVANKAAGGQYNQRITVSGKDEVGQLAETFNEMIGAIQHREENLKAARLEAERADQVKSAFLASMSHELRTPLNGIINFTGFVADGMLGPINEEQTQFLRDVIINAEHLLALINDVLDISKIEAGSLHLFVESSVDLTREIDTVARTGKTLLSDRPVEMKVNVSPDLPTIQGDRRRIRQIMLNLVSNACKFTDEGSVTLTAQQDGENILISVMDTGPGIDPKDHEAIFETFLQTETGLRKGGGTGLGLPISRKLAEAHGGRLWMTSEPGKGATFFVSLPIHPEHLKMSVIS